MFDHLGADLAGHKIVKGCLSFRPLHQEMPETDSGSAVQIVELVPADPLGILVISLPLRAFLINQFNTEFSGQVFDCVNLVDLLHFHDKINNASALAAAKAVV
jgi:hypothetical protein